MSSAGAQTSVKVVAGLIYRNGRLLVCRRRADGEFPLKWEFPGGKMEEGESEVAALKRELREELHIDVGGVKFIGQYDHGYEIGPTVSLRFFYVLDFAGTPQNVVFEQISWVKLSELETLDFLEGDRQLIKRLISPAGEALFES